MESSLLQIIAATFFISLLSFAGVFSLSLKKKFLEKNIGLLVSFAAGSILAAVFFDLIPEAFTELGNFNFVLVGIILFFIFEAGIHWHHRHGETECKDCIEPVAFLNLFGDALHNFLDGVLIAASFILGYGTGIATTIAVGLHEIPQEIGDFSVLLKGGLKRKSAILLNFVSAIFALLGGIVGYFFLNSLSGLLPYVISIAAGGLLYIATTDVLPDLHKERNYKKVILQIIAFAFGIILISIILGIFPE